MVRAKKYFSDGSGLGKRLQTIPNLPPFQISPVVLLFTPGWVGLSVLVPRDK